MNIIITGASGFLGSALAKKLGKGGCSVSLLIRKQTNLHRLKDLLPYKIGYCGTDEEISRFIFDVNPDVVIHAACCYGRKGESALEVIDANIRLGVVILNAVKNLEKNVSFVNVGTVLSRNVSFYALTKLQFEEIGRYAAITSNPNTQFINVRLQYMYGPGDEASKFTTHVINSCMKNISELPLTFGSQKRDFVFIEDVVDAFLVILANLYKLNRIEQIDLGSGAALKLRDFVWTVHRLTNSKTKLMFGKVPYRENDEMCLVANIEMLKNLGWIPRFDLESGIKKTIEIEAGGVMR